MDEQCSPLWDSHHGDYRETCKVCYCKWCDWLHKISIFFNESIFSTNVSLISIERVGPMIAYPESLFIKTRFLKVLFDRAIGASWTF